MKILNKIMQVALVSIAMGLSLVSCSSDDKENSPERMSALIGQWVDDQEHDTWIFRPGSKLESYSKYLDVLSFFLCVENYANNGTYLYDSKKELMYLSIRGESTVAEVVSMGSDEFILKEGKILVRFTKLCSETEGKSPENMAGKRLAIGVANERNIIFKSNTSCEIKLDNDEVMYNEVRISETPVCLYKKADEKTAKLSYSYGITGVSQGFYGNYPFGYTYRGELTLHFQTPEFGYVMGNCMATNLLGAEIVRDLDYTCFIIE